VNTSKKAKVYKSNGSPLALEAEIGKGGEGSVFGLVSDAEHVAKIYHEPINQMKAEKLRFMTGLKTDSLLRLTAWPVDTLFDKPGGRMIGLLMPRVAGHADIHVLYGVKSRLSTFPDAKWTFLIHTAANVARAFGVIHQHGHVIGDVNERSVLVSKDATVRLIDCDSFQITVNGRSCLCEVGVPTHTPPELQGLKLSSVVRTTNHDNFGMAVFIFQLLFMGRHPFSGTFLGRGEMPLEKAIRENRFAYGREAKVRQMRQPPGSLSMDCVTPRLAALFDLAFSSGTIRPGSADWIPALEELSNQLKRCQTNNGHYFLAALSVCPLCDIENNSGAILFNVVATVTWRTQGTFNLATLWAQVSAVERPGPLPTLPARASLILSPSKEATDLRKSRRLRVVYSSIAGGTLSALVLASSLSIGPSVICLIVVGLVCITAIRSGNDARGNTIDAARKSAESKWRSLEERWHREAAASPFDIKLGELESKKQSHQAVPALRNERLQKLQADQRQRQLNRFLDRFRIEDAHIGSIGPSRTATLQSYGIETAADVSIHAILAIPGFGPSFASKLLDWRASVEKKFVFNRSQSIDPADLQALDRDIGLMKVKLENELRSGLAELQRLSHRIQSARTTMKPMLEESLRELAQAEVDCKAKQLTSSVVPIIVISSLALLIALPLKYRNNGVSRKDLVSSTTQTQQSTPPTQPLAPLVGLLSPQEQAGIQYQEGLGYTRKGRYRDAAAAYIKAIAFKPDYAEAYHELGYANLRLGDYEGAIAATNQALKLQPHNSESLNNLGQAYVGADRWREAKTAFQQATVENPKSAAAYYNLGTACKRLYDYEGATEAFYESAVLKPRNALAHYELGLAYLATGRRDAAYDEYIVLMELDTKLAQRLSNEIENKTSPR
jgi:DNA-binding helix-hairpin-helix protein with protein kinase domain/Flp pilus assembly protein TadD